MFLLGILLGIAIGMFVMVLISLNKINEYEEDLHTQILLRKRRDKLINYLFNRNTELKEIIRDEENNIEFLVNNLSEKNKKLARPDNQN